MRIVGLLLLERRCGCDNDDDDDCAAVGAGADAASPAEDVGAPSDDGAEDGCAVAVAATASSPFFVVRNRENKPPPLLGGDVVFLTSAPAPFPTPVGTTAFGCTACRALSSRCCMRLSKVSSSGTGEGP